MRIETKAILIAILFMAPEAAAGLPRYSTSLLEVSLGGGAQGASIETNYLSSAQNQTIGKFYIGGALNPLWFFISDDKPGQLHYFDVFINAGYNLMGTTALYDTSYTQTQGYYTENRNFSVTYQPSSFNLGSNLKLGLLPFLDIAGGVGLNIGNGTGNFGQKVEIFIFGECSPEKTKADRQILYINQENEKHEQEIENIKRSIGYHDAVKKLNSIR